MGLIPILRISLDEPFQNFSHSKKKYFLIEKEREIIEYAQLEEIYTLPFFIYTLFLESVHNLHKWSWIDKPLRPNRNLGYAKSKNHKDFWNFRFFKSYL